MRKDNSKRRQVLRKVGRLVLDRPELLESRQLLSNIFMVENTAGDGTVGSLAWAIGKVNADGTDTVADPDQINFDLKTNDPNYNGTYWTIPLASALPQVTNPVAINGISQLGATQNTLTNATNAQVKVAIDANNFTGLELSSAGVTVDGLSIFDAQTYAIQIDTTGGAYIHGNFIGVDPTGAPRTNRGDGIVINGVGSNTIGGTIAASTNLIAGNGQGIAVTGAGSNLIQGNLIGSNPAGTAVVANTEDGISISESSNNTIRNNLIGGSQSDGVLLAGVGTTGNRIAGNFIGINAAGVAIPSGGNGVQINGGASANTVGGTVALDRNVITDNTLDGVLITGVNAPVGTTTNSNVVEGNYIGTNPSGGMASSSSSPSPTATTPSATFLKKDSTTQGSWIGTYGGEGYDIAAGPNVPPSYVTPTTTASTFTFDPSTTDPRALQIPTVLGPPPSNPQADGLAAAYFAGPPDTIMFDLNVTDGNAHQLAIYALDWDGNNTRQETVSIEDAVTHAVLDTQTLTAFSGGDYLVWTITGHVQVVVTDLNPPTSQNAVVSGLFFGDTVAPPGPKQVNGVEISAGATSNTIGGSTAGAKNVISGNGNDGVLISGSARVGKAAPTGNLVAGNNIGKTADDSATLPNFANGVEIAAGASANSIGGATAGFRNVIDDNGNDGVLITGATTANNAVIFNNIDPNAANGVEIVNGANGTLVAQNNITANGGNGVLIGSGANANTIGAGNVIGINLGDGVLITDAGSDNNLVYGNFIGVDAGAIAIPNGGDGVEIKLGATGNTIGGLLATAGNTISDNNTNGIEISSNANLVSENIIESNSANGVLIDGGGSNNTIGVGNIIGDNFTDGVLITGLNTNNNLVYGNFIGVGASNNPLPNGLSGVEIAQGATGNTIGGAVSSAGNLINDNTTDGVFISSDGNFVGFNTIAGNAIDGVGLHANANSVFENVIVGNASNGIKIEAGASNNSIGAGNVIGSNVADGILITGVGTTGNLVYANSIGSDASANPLPNGTNGVEIAAGATENTIGGSVLNGNSIDNNKSNGVLISSDDNVVRFNSLSDNVDDGLKITGNANLAFGNNIVGNGFDGVGISDGATNNTIGAGNVIGNNLGDGVLITGAGTTQNLVFGNFIGVDEADGPLPNGANGVEIATGATANTVGGTSAAAANVINQNKSNGVLIRSDNNTVGFNTISANVLDGLLITGNNNAAFGNTIEDNGSNGVELSGGATGNIIDAGNVIGDNVAAGVLITGAGTTENLVDANFIGVDASNAPIPNGTYGVEIVAGADGNTIGGMHAAAGNVISKNTNEGVLITSDNNVIGSNTISGNGFNGLLISGNGNLAFDNTIESNGVNGVELSDGATNNSIGGGNVIGKNTDDGVLITGAGTTENVVYGNFIGVGFPSGALPNGTNGVEISSGATANTIGGATGNNISNNTKDGVLITADDNTVGANTISGNTINGIEISGNGNTAFGNTIESNGDNGVKLEDGASNNSIGADNVIGNNFADGILITDAGTTANVVYGNFIGVDASNAPIPNGAYGVEIAAEADGNTIGGGAAAGGNVISKNTNDGVLITSDNNVVGFNTISGNGFNGILTNGTGNSAFGNTIESNGDNGVELSAGATNNSIGAGNVIGNNTDDGVLITGAGTTGNVVFGNFIGVNATNTALPNGTNGVEIASGANGNEVGGSTSAAGNVIAQNKNDGVLVGTSFNFVGFNTISSNGRDGIEITGNGNTVFGNTISTNTANGVRIEGTASQNSIGDGNVITLNGADGVLVTDAGAAENVIFGNYIGTDKTGAANLGNAQNGVDITNGAHGTLVGGTNPTGTKPGVTGFLGNVISGNTLDGILIATAGTTGNLVAGNYIGTDVNGTAAVPNGKDGVELFSLPAAAPGSPNTVGGTTAGSGNVISGNAAWGVSIADASNQLVEGNTIGLGADGNILTNGAGRGNAKGGVEVITETSVSTGNTIGGLVAGAQNVIAGNTGDGVLLSTTGTTTTLVVGNAIGTDSTGAFNRANTGNGVQINAGSGLNTIGGSVAAAANLINFNGNDGVLITGAATTANSVGSNAVEKNAVNGLEIAAGASGNVAFANVFESNGLNGVKIASGATANTIGAGNVIGLNAADGILITGPGTSANLVEGNFIGTNASNSTLRGNAKNGVEIANGADSNTLGGTTDAGANVIGSNGADGVLLTDSGTTKNLVIGNRIGIGSNPAAPALPNGGNGVAIVNHANANTIGGSLATDANAIVFNKSSGVRIGSSASANLVANNFMTDNAFDGILITESASANLISANDIQGNFGNGLELTGGASGNSGVGNFVDSNGLNGVKLAGGAVNNSISGNQMTTSGLDGVLITDPGTSQNVLSGNLIGLAAGSGFPLGNRGSGVEIANGASGNTIGGSTAAAGNQIDYNSNDGVVVIGLGTTGNSVGFNTLISNGGNGIEVSGGASGNNFFSNTIVGSTGNGVALLSGATQNVVGPNNVIGFNQQNGVLISDAATTKNVITGNNVGLTATFTNAANGQNGVLITNNATGNLIGGTSPSAANFISDNFANGVVIANASSNAVSSNVIMGNVGNGVWVTSSTSGTATGNAIGFANIISGNGLDGVLLNGPNTSGNTVAGNLIGTDVQGLTPNPNLGNGVEISVGAHGNVIGGVTDAARNVISGNGNANIPYQNQAIPAANVLIDGTSGGADGNLVVGNFVGTDATGVNPLTKLSPTTPVYRTPIGIYVLNAKNNIIGTGTTNDGRNVVAGNNFVGIEVQNTTTNDGSGASGNTIANNFVGINVNGQALDLNGNPITNGQIDSNGTVNVLANGVTGPVANALGLNTKFTTNSPVGAGVFLSQASSNVLQGNVISGNLGVGVEISGDRPLQNGTAGGVPVGLAGSNNTITGNKIGTGADGQTPVGNVLDGVYVVNAQKAVITGNTISANQQSGIHLYKANTFGYTIRGNNLGSNANGQPGGFTFGTYLGNYAYGVLIDDNVGYTAKKHSSITGNNYSFNNFGAIFNTNLAPGNRVPANRRRYQPIVPSLGQTVPQGPAPSVRTKNGRRGG